MVQSTAEIAANARSPYREQFERLEQKVKQPAWLQPLRRAGICSFEEQGFPSLKQEDWRFTNVAPIARLPFKPQLEASEDEAAAAALQCGALESLPGSRLVFLNGLYCAKLSSVLALPTGVKVGSLASALSEPGTLTQGHLARYALTGDNGFVALNQAFFLDGAFIYLPAGSTVDEPIRLVFQSTGNQSGSVAHPRNLILAEAGSRATVIECYLGGAGVYWTNTVTELVTGESASIELLKFQDESPAAYHVATIHGRLGRQSRVSIHSIALGAKLSRNNIRTTLAGEGLECVLNGLYLTRDEQLADHHMIVDHAQPHCASHEYFNGILDDRSRGVFHGRIHVHQIAQKTDAKQTNKNLLLSDDAIVDTKPQLEIYADDVKCTHGATVGQLNEESIFYLRSRGIGSEMARRMLIHAFAGEIIDRIRCRPAREALDKIVWERLESNPHLAASPGPTGSRPTRIDGVRA
jgi:Fe-S cluster assembly protein SufD